MNNSIVIIGNTNYDCNKLYINYIILEDENGKEYPLHWTTFVWSEGKDMKGQSIITASGCFIPLEYTQNEEIGLIEMDRIMNTIVRFYPVYSEDAPEDYEFILEEITYCSDIYTPIISEYLETMNNKFKEIGRETIDVVKFTNLIKQDIQNPFLTLKIHNEINNGEE
jgi:hypothetical protein